MGRRNSGFSHSRVPRLLASTALIALLAGAVVGCKTLDGDTPTGSIATTPAPAPGSKDDAAWRREIEIFGERFRADPKDTESAIRYAQGLRAIGQRAQAVAVLEQAALHNPKSMPLLGAYGRALADNGNYEKALDVLGRAHTPDHPDWRILSVQGAVLDQLGRNDDARRYYASALKLMPNEPSVLSNLGLSYVLSKDLAKAEATLRKAVAQPNADPRARQNLALVVGLRGRFDEAEKIASADLPPEEASANIAYLRELLAQRDPVKRASRPGA